MFAASEYELLDFGAGRKLERFGQFILDRPAPVADGIKQIKPKLWSGATAHFEISAGRSSQVKSQRGRWMILHPLPAIWTVGHKKSKFELKLTNFGHVGLFPEQADNWDWIADQVRSAMEFKTERPLRVLNLFAYTGGSTLAAAAAGAEVTHVDAGRNIVAWARQNAELSGLSAAPIRWIVDDVLKFARRELKRGKQHDAVILDPPSYGHGAKGEMWKLADQLSELLGICRELAGPNWRFVVLTCHAPDYTPERLAECLRKAGFAKNLKQIESGDLSLITTGDRQLHAGMFARTASMNS